MQAMESRGCSRSHAEFKELFGMVTRGAYFALVSCGSQYKLTNSAQRSMASWTSTASRGSYTSIWTCTCPQCPIARTSAGCAPSQP